MKNLKLTLLLIVLFSFEVFGQSFTETFDTAPLPCGGSNCTSFSRTINGVQFDFEYASGEPGDFQYNSTDGNINILTFFPQDDAIIETVTVNRSDNQNFILSSIEIDNRGGFAPEHNVTVTGKLGGSTVGSQVMAAGSTGTLNFSDIEIDLIEITTGSFEAVLMDNFSGQIPASTPDLSINDIALTENNTTASFTVSLSASSSSTVTVDYATANGTATSGSDYTATSGTLTFLAGETSKTIDVPILEDALYENNEVFYVNLTNPVNANIADSQGQCTINNDDPAPTVTFNPSVTSASEGDGTIDIVCELSAVSGLATTINFSFSGTATQGVDYTASSSLIIAAGDISDNIPINIIDDNLDESDETIIVDITSVTNGTESGGFQQVTYTINDDDETPVVTPGQSFSVNENSAASTVVGTVAATDSDAGTTFQNWTITTNANPDGDGNNAFSINSSTGQITVNDPGDLNYEANTSLIIQVTVSDGTNTSSAENVTININDVDDVAPTIVTNTGITLNEGATETINNTELQANDTDTNNDNLVYAITAGPSNGQLELTTGPGVPVTSFTQAQLNANQVVYVHDDGNSTSDSFTFDVQDGSGNNLVGQIFSITINPIDDTAPSIITNTGITLNEGDTETINSSELQADDPDTNNDNLVYSVTSSPSNGQLELTTGPGVITSFTQAQLNANQVIYIHNGSNTTSDSFTFDVQDGSGNNLTGQTFSITIIPVDDDTPTLINNTGITLNEGDTEIIDSGELRANDTDTDNNTLVFAITAGPANGQIELTTNPGVPVSSFTQTQVVNNQVVYVHDDSNTTSDSFTFDVQDGSGNNLTGQTFSITINPIDDDTPVITVNTGITLDEGATETIDSGELQANDPDTDNNTLVYAVTAAPANGQLELTTGPGVAITNFTQAQLNANQVIYIHDDGNSTSDSFTFDVQDGSGNNLTGQTFSITINPIDDDAPVITANTGITLNEGATETIDSGELQASDPDTDDNTLVYDITTIPANGQLELTTGPGVAITNFTQAQLNANQVVYIHDDSNTTSDSFTFDVQDGSGNNLTGQTFSITINPVDDDAPVITVNTGITLNEGATETIDSGKLQANDPDTDNNTLVYAVTAAPANGQLELTTGPGVAITNFTQAQLNANQVIYIHDGGNSTSDSFTFDVQDGSGNNLTGQTFSITINPIDDDAPVITANTGITLDEGATETIDSGELQASDPDTDDNTLVYDITTIPANGQLELTTGPGVAITNFTQAQLNANQVVYVHDDSNTTSDSFTFDVQDGSGNNLTGQTFNITINPVDDDVPTVTINNGITLSEGATETIDSGELQANDTDTNNDALIFAITAAPANGQIELTSGPGVAINSFTQAQLNANLVVYVHDGGNSISDSFTFDVQDGSGNNLTGQTFSITINPIDDDAPVITANTGITLDEGATETIDSGELQASDPDTDDNILVYDITTTPANGQLELTTGPGVAITNFTQAQLNANQVVYVHDDSNTTSDSFTFDVQDGSGNDLTGQTFNITINPVDDDVPTVTINTGITLIEGASEIIDSGELQANDTDTNNDALTYVITAAPANGQIELTSGSGVAINSFTQAQLNANLVVYIHDGSNSISDSFTFDVQDGSGNDLTGQNFNITITPVDDTAPTITTNTGITLDEGATETIGSGELQADDEDTNNDDLTYVVTTSPVNGQLELTSGPGVAITSFTQAQLNANQVIYTHDHSNTTSDSFDFDVQDGSGNNLTGQTFSITINPVDDDAPIAADDSYSTDEDVPLNISAPGVLSNDTDTEATSLTAILESGPSNGTLALNADGSFTYTPEADFNGSDSFTYRANDGSNTSAVATVTITINAVNDAPAITELADIEIEVNTTSDVLSFTISDIDNATGDLEVSATSDNTSLIPVSGITLAGSDGNRTIQVQPAADATGTALITITVTDGDKQATTSFNVSVVVVNTAPTDIALSNTSLIETLGLGEVVGTFSTTDVDVGDTFTYTLVEGTGDDDNSSFDIEENKLVAAAKFNVDVQQQFSIRVRSTDNREAFVEKSFTLTLLPDTELEPIIYTGFTPDGDGANDTWEIDNISGHPNIEVRIYNRNGQEIFKSIGYEKPWDGTFNGRGLPVDTYFYVIKLNDSAGRTFKGTVMILK
ncbi:hypothetical protein C900_01392 [Fulvivirga imtechensis AK7]|uniref:Cadherin domain-containing protein n=1 Tax=Fulvivirga imtechensis AK7 TaxID=1237149 RepID=L8K2V5_9BACT|nr:cadherin-like domain-containing protein [Fulvivirga imtechensis]ELR73782.1 hypothetical protein C900_01392 [Fulvivirga imtechensis AK7]